MNAWPQLRESRTIQAGRAPRAVVRCGLMDTMLADLPVSVVLFFPGALDPGRLAESLAVVLDRLPVFGGRLRTTADGLLEIVCDDAGIPMAVYDVDQTLSEAMARVALPGSGYADHVEASKARTGGRPLLTVRISRLSDGGTALGVSWHHAVGDMQTFALLMHAWSAALSGRPLPEVRLVPDRDAYLDSVLPARDAGRPGFRLPTPEEAQRLNHEIAVSLRANRSVQVYFGDAETERMRERFSAAAGQRVSAGDALCAHVVDTVRSLDDDPESRHLTVPVNVRRPLGLPADIVGNLLGEVHLKCPPHGAPAVLAAALRGAIRDFTRSHLSLRASHAFLEKIGRGRFGECVPLGFDPERRTMTFSNWSRFGLYDADFDGQYPVFLSPAPNLQLPYVAWLVEGFQGRGSLLTAVLPARLAARLRGADGRAALHRFRSPDEDLPAPAGTMRRLL